MVARIIPVEPFDLVIFGGTGDLARRKILPGLYRRLADGQMPADARVIGAARSASSDEDYRALVRTALEEFLPVSVIDPEMISRFLDMAIGSASEVECQARIARDLGYVTGEAYERVAERLTKVRRDLVAFRNHIQKKPA